MSTVSHSVYLDYNATAPLRPQVWEAMHALAFAPANASSVHRYGRQAKKWLENSRAAIAQMLNCWPNEIIFTASGTEANHLALRGVSGRRVVVSATEHSSVLKAVSPDALIPVDARGVVRLDALEALLAQSSQPALVSVMFANNETGVMQPIADIAQLCRGHGALLHCDAVQAVGKIPLDFTSLQADLLTLSAHKCGGPFGVAALVIKNNLALAPIFLGGGQELGRRAGTENIPAIAGFAKALELAGDLSTIQRLEGWVREAEKRCEALGAVVHGKGAPRLPNSLNLSMPGVNSEVQLMNLDLAGIAVSAGSACSSGKVELSHVLRSMGVADALASSAIRISAGWNSTPEDLCRFAEEWAKIRLRLVPGPGIRQGAAEVELRTILNS